MNALDNRTLEGFCSSLLDVWSSALYGLQLDGTGDKRVDGALICPACGKIHGRCFEAMYPFLRMASDTGDEKWVESAISLFEWAENVVSQPDGSYLNDIDSPWKGTTVFNVIQMVDCLLFHSSVLPDGFVDRLSARLGSAADFLYGYTGLKSNNINYPVSNALALQLCGRYFNDARYLERSEEFKEVVADCFTSGGLIYGEGIPRSARTAKGCPSVDIGYNVEESLPSLARLALITDDMSLQDKVEKTLVSHLDFMLEDGGWDNSFGTRNFKWTYWGSRTSDGCAAGYLAFGERNPVFTEAAIRNLLLMEKCTVDGLLAGGMQYDRAGQPVCVHHTFTHAKVLASILDGHLCDGVSISENRPLLPRMGHEGIRFYPEIDTYIMTRGAVTATVTGYDWEYMRAGHVSGGTLSMLFHEKVGVLLCAGMCEYSIKEKNNQQVPVGTIIHSCLAPRLECVADGRMYSSVYDCSASIERTGGSVSVKGMLADVDHRRSGIGYDITYTLFEDGIRLRVACDCGTFVCPLVCDVFPDSLPVDGNTVEITRDSGSLVFTVEEGGLPYLLGGCDRIFNLVPGFSAVPVRLDINGVACFSIRAEGR